MTERLMYQYTRSLAQRLKTYATHVDVAKHGDVKGLAREGFIKITLAEFLPTIIDYRTGEIIDQNDQSSGQVDVILQSALFPKLLLYGDINIALVDSVSAVIEVKSSLTTGKMNETASNHLKKALDTFAKVKALKRQHAIRAQKPYGTITLPHTPCFLFAYTGPTAKTLCNKLLEYGQVRKLDPSVYWPEVIVVLDHAYSITCHDGWLYNPTKRDGVLSCGTKQILVDNGEENVLVHLFMYLCDLIVSHHWYMESIHFGPFFSRLTEARI